MLWAVTAPQTTQSLSGRTLVHSIWEWDGHFSDLVLGEKVSALTATGGVCLQLKVEFAVYKDGIKVIPELQRSHLSKND